MCMERRGIKCVWAFLYAVMLSEDETAECLNTDVSII